MQEAGYKLGSLASTCLLLSRNSRFPWFILVPDTQETEFYKLKHEHQLLLLEQINQLSIFVEKHFPVCKLNIATIGNIVSQLHIHIVGRHQNDACWPGVVWGCDQVKNYNDGEVENIRDQLEMDCANDLISNFIATR